MSPIVQSLLRQSLSGLIIAPIADDQSYLDAWADRTQLVFVDRRPSGVAADSFTEDDHAGAHAATPHLVEHGHVRIGFLGDSTHDPHHAAASDGLPGRPARAGLPLDDALVALGALDRSMAAETFAALEAADPPTALFSSNARAAMSLAPILRDSGLAVGLSATSRWRTS